MKIYYEDKHIIVCQKDAGVLSEGDDASCLPRLLHDYLELHGEKSPTVYPVHRLDRETVGVMVFALNKECAANLSEQICDGGFEKEYLAVCHGVPEEISSTLTDLLYYDRKRGKSFTVDRVRAGVKRASLEYTVIKSCNGMSLLRIKLHTGRTHQIRVQFASRKHPLAGDRRYGAPKSEFATVALAACKLTFTHPRTGKRMTFEADTPELFNLPFSKQDV